MKYAVTEDGYLWTGKIVHYSDDQRFPVYDLDGSELFLGMLQIDKEFENEKDARKYQKENYYYWKVIRKDGAIIAKCSNKKEALEVKRNYTYLYGKLKIKKVS